MLWFAPIAALADDVGVHHVTDGLGPGTVSDVHVDPDGWVWVATIGGLFRYEQPARRWGGGFNDAVDTIVAVRGDVALVVLSYGRLASATRDQVTLIRGADGEPIAVTAAALDPGGRVWVVRDGHVQRGASEGWVTVDLGLADGDRPRNVQWLEADEGWVASDHALVQIDGEGRVVARYAIDDPYGVARTASGRRIVQIGWGAIAEVRGDTIVTLFAPPPDRSVGFVIRGDDVWNATSRGLWRWRDGALRSFDAADGLAAGGSLALDREGGLWMGGFLGLFHLPAPETVIWTAPDGLPDSHPRTVAVDADGTRWTASWQGPGRLSADGIGARVDAVATEGDLCRDGAGGLWTGGLAPGDAGVWRAMRFGQPVTWGPALAGAYWDCASDPQGGVWLATTAGIAHLDPDGTLGPLVGPGSFRVHATARGVVWRSSGDGICGAAAATVRAGTASWRCTPWPDDRFVSDFLEVGDEVWATTLGAGVLRWDGAAWHPLAGSLAEPTRYLLWMTPSPRGGVWVAGHGVTLRAEPDGRGDWRVLERIGASEGLPIPVSHHVVEEARGRLHVATPAGLVEIPAEARNRPRPLPRPVPVAARLDGVAFDPRAPQRVSGTGHRLEIDASVPAYRDAGALRWRVRTAPGAPWSAATDTPRFHWVDLAPGRVAVEVAVSDDGETWVAAAIVPRVTVLRPWYARGLALAVWATLAGAATYLAYRLRVATLLRVERERTRIAMDLHDEIGSGLGSITLLAGLAADEAVGDAERRGVAADAARIAQDLAGSLGDIVWSLGRDAGSPDALVGFLADRGARMFDPERTTFVVERPTTFPPTELTLAVRREVKHIGIEALHNAAKHAEPTSVILRFTPGARWRLEVEDDGRGLDVPSRRAGTGLGRAGMRARAARIGATLTWTPRPGGGTVVTLGFDPRGGRWPWPFR